jgi:1,4-dihydroxy-2-naphthoyl-CoA hydrolase
MTNLSYAEAEANPAEFFNAERLGALAHAMGIQITEFTRDQIVATMPVTGNTQTFGIMHGGAYVVLGESLGSLHANLMAPEGKIGVGIDVNATHTGAAADGQVTGVCRPIHLGSSLSVHEIAITNEDGRRCSTIRITNLYRPSN